jgi:hypothetical protein
MRFVFPSFLLGSVIVAALTACSADKSSGSTAPSGDSTSTTAYNVAIDTLTMRDSDSVVVGTALPVRVLVTQAGLPAPGVSVSWAVATGHSQLSSAISTSDSLGFATVSWTMGDTTGITSVTAVAGGASVTLYAISVAAAPATLERVSDDTSWVVGGASQLIIARTRDRFGNFVSGATVTWSTSDGQLTPTESITGTSGNATTTFTAPMSSSVSIITATLPGKASVSFRVVAVYDAAELAALRRKRAKQ